MTNSPSYIVCDDYIIIDDIILFSNHVLTILHNFSYVTRVFTKYRLSFKLSKYDFFSLALNMLVTISLLAVIVLLHRTSIYYKTGHFHPTEYRFYPSSVCVNSIIDISPDLKETLNHCKKLQRVYHRNDIPIIGWIQFSIQLFEDCKTKLVTSHLLLHYDSSKPTILKKYWSASDMWYILIQSDDSSVSLAAIKRLSLTSECSFDLFLDIPWYNVFCFSLVQTWLMNGIAISLLVR